MKRTMLHLRKSGRVRNKVIRTCIKIQNVTKVGTDKTYSKKHQKIKQKHNVLVPKKKRKKNKTDRLGERKTSVGKL